MVSITGIFGGVGARSRYDNDIVKAKTTYDRIQISKYRLTVFLFIFTGYL